MFIIINESCMLPEAYYYTEKETTLETLRNLITSRPCRIFHRESLPVGSSSFYDPLFSGNESVLSYESIDILSIPFTTPKDRLVVDTNIPPLGFLVCISKNKPIRVVELTIYIKKGMWDVFGYGVENFYPLTSLIPSFGVAKDFAENLYDVDDFGSEDSPAAKLTLEVMNNQGIHVLDSFIDTVKQAKYEVNALSSPKDLLPPFINIDQKQFKVLQRRFTNVMHHGLSYLDKDILRLLYRIYNRHKYMVGVWSCSGHSEHIDVHGYTEGYLVLAVSPDITTEELAKFNNICQDVESSGFINYELHKKMPYIFGGSSNGTYPAVIFRSITLKKVGEIRGWIKELNDILIKNM